MKKQNMLFFDLDGTLYRTHETCLPPFRTLCEQYGIKLTKEDEALLLYTTTATLLSKVAPDMPEEQKNKFGHEIKWRKIEEVKRHGRLFDGATVLLSSLRKSGFQLAICGMGSKEYINCVVDRCGIRQYFEAILHGIEGKTKGQVLSEYITNNQLCAEDCIMIGDSITDLTAARDNGISFIGVSYGYGAKEIRDNAVMLDSIAQIEAEIYKTLVYSQIEKGIKNLDRPTVVGISGVDTSGKTVFSKAFSEFLRRKGYHTQLLHMDDFHNPRQIRYQDTSPQGYIDYAFDLKQLNSVLVEIKSGVSHSEITVLDLDLDTYTKKLNIHTTANTVIILEGVMLYRPPIIDLVDYKAFLDIGFDEVLKRAKKRDVPKYGENFLERYKQRYIPAQKKYLSEYNPTKTCDLLIDNNDYNKPLV